MKTTKLNPGILIIAVFLTMSLIAFGAVAHAATISGTVRNSVGAAITDATITVEAFQGDQCEGLQWVGSVGTSNGIYTIINLPAGTYFLRTENGGHSEYVNEFHTGGDPDPSSPDCSQAIQVDVTSTDAIGKDFKLDIGYSISGKVYKSDGTTLITDAVIDVGVLQGDDSCGWLQWMGDITITTGNYTIRGLPTGSYFLHTQNRNESNYVNEFHTGGETDPSSPDCGQALAIEVSAGVPIVSDIDFNLDTGGSISGNLYKSDGETLIEDAQIEVAVINGNPCEWHQWIGSIHTSNGSYTIMGLPVGTWYMRTDNNNESNYVNEWHTGGSPDPSSPDCGQAVEVSVTEGGTTPDINFNLDTGGSISGIVADSLGAAIDGTATLIQVSVYQGDPCGWRQHIGGAFQDASGVYTIMGLPVGTYYLQTNNNNESNYVNEWHTGATDPSSFDCELATQVSVTEGGTTPDIDFELEMGGSVSGTVYQGGSVAEGARVVAWLGDPCEDRQWMADAWTDENGEYKIWGLPAGTCYVQTQNDNEYADEWYADTASAYYCYEAEPVTVVSELDQPGINFQLATRAGGFSY
jgi:hypothetical protein